MWIMRRRAELRPARMTDDELRGCLEGMAESGSIRGVLELLERYKDAYVDLARDPRNASQAAILMARVDAAVDVGAHVREWTEAKSQERRGKSQEGRGRNAFVAFV